MMALNIWIMEVGCSPVEEGYPTGSGGARSVTRQVPISSSRTLQQSIRKKRRNLLKADYSQFLSHYCCVPRHWQPFRPKCRPGKVELPYGGGNTLTCRTIGEALWQQNPRHKIPHLCICNLQTNDGGSIFLSSMQQVSFANF
jgi:hypothetical protein